MPIGRLARLPVGLGAPQYDAVVSALGLSENPPEGLIFHCAGEGEGSFQVFNLWETAQHADRFERERLDPAREAVFGRDRARATQAGIVDFAVHNYEMPHLAAR
jgi:hypothetical protein